MPRSTTSNNTDLKGTDAADDEIASASAETIRKKVKGAYQGRPTGLPLIEKKLTPELYKLIYLALHSGVVFDKDKLSQLYRLPLQFVASLNASYSQQPRFNKSMEQLVCELDSHQYVFSCNAMQVSKAAEAGASTDKATLSHKTSKPVSRM